ncbi:hypothetical protein D3C81_1302700 [compost metagenome]
MNFDVAGSLFVHLHAQGSTIHFVPLPRATAEHFEQWSGVAVLGLLAPHKLCNDAAQVVEIPGALVINGVVTGEHVRDDHAL